MTYFHACRNCQHASTDCAIRNGIRAAVKSLGISSLKHKCASRVPLYSSGDRVAVTWPVATGDTDDWGRTAYDLVTWPATVVSERGSRFLIAVDDVLGDDCETKASDYMKSGLFGRVSPDRLKPLDEPRRTLCRSCDTAAPEYSGCCAQPAGFGHSAWAPMHCAKAASLQIHKDVA